MVEQQLVEYIKSQLLGGAARGAIKSALLGAGWPETDVEDTLKSAEASAPTKTAPAIVVSDLLKSSNMAMVVGVGAAKEMKAENAKPLKIQEKIGAKKFNRTLVVEIALGAAAAIFIASSVYLYLESSSLKSAVEANSAVAGAANAKVAELNSHVGDLNKQITDLNSRTATLAGDNQKLLLELSFFISLPGSSSVETAFTLKGNVSAGRVYAVTADDGLKVTVKNSKDAKVDAALKPMVGQIAEISGTHFAGSRDVTVTAVNGVTLAAASSTASSTSPQ